MSRGSMLLQDTLRSGSTSLTTALDAGGLTTTHTRLSVYVLWRKAEDASYLRETSSKTRRPPRPDLTVGLEAFYDHIALGLVLEEVTEE